MPRRILILNWRDIKNPNSGGAEVLTHEMARRWVLLGNEVSQFSSIFKNAEEEDVVDGVRIIRRGNPDARYLFKSVHFEAFLYYLKNRNKFDVVIDEIHGLPFFTPLYIGKKKIALICEVAGKIWDTNFPFPFNKIGKAIERNYFKLYGDVHFLTISPSTKNDLIEFGVKSTKISVLPMGISLPKTLPSSEKEKYPTLIFVGRLLKAKGIEDAIKVCAKLKDNGINVHLWIIGRGEQGYENQLRMLVKKLGLSSNVDFLGFLSQDKKFEMLGKAHILLAPSIKEGFGLTIPEAGIVGTPSIAYNVEGLRDIVINMKSGVLVDISPDKMANRVERVLTDEALYKRLQEGARKFAKSLSWDNTAKEALMLIEKIH